jgi:holliday junction DNA helicase RuvA
MIAKLAGLVDQVGSDCVVIDVGGVGYLAFCSTRTLGNLPPAGSPAALLIETHVREDHIHLYGFTDSAERDWFRRLMTVQGVGARLALGILSAVSPQELGLSILAQDKATLTRADGVGPRLATRIVNELRDKVESVAATVSPTAPVVLAADQDSGPTADAVSALVNLGYRRSEAFGAVATAARRLGAAADAAALIRGGLQELTR